MSAFTDVVPKVDGPKQGAIQFVRVEDGWCGEAGVGIVSGYAHHVHDDFICTVAIQVGG